MRLNLGCGFHKLDGYVNVDKEPACEPDEIVDLEDLPWPFKDSTAEEVLLIHALEHLGQTNEAYLAIIQELYRVAVPDARISITVPHPRHDEFLIDPTHVRPILPEQFHLYSKRRNREALERGLAQTPLGLYLDVDFEVENIELVPAEPWFARLKAGEMSSEELAHMAMHQFNILREVTIELRAVK